MVTDKIYISEEKIKKAINKVAKEIDQTYKNKPLLIVGVLKSAAFFTVDLCRAITIPCEIDYIIVQSYHHNAIPGVKIINQLNIKNLHNYHIIILDDLVESGRTLNFIVNEIQKLNPLSIKTIVLLDKPYKRQGSFEPDIVLFTIPDYYLVGYGIDYQEKYRNLPYIIRIE